MSEARTVCAAQPPRLTRLCHGRVTTTRSLPTGTETRAAAGHRRIRAVRSPAMSASDINDMPRYDAPSGLNGPLLNLLATYVIAAVLVIGAASIQMILVDV